MIGDASTPWEQLTAIARQADAISGFILGLAIDLELPGLSALADARRRAIGDIVDAAALEPEITLDHIATATEHLHRLDAVAAITMAACAEQCRHIAERLLRAGTA